MLCFVASRLPSNVHATSLSVSLAGDPVFPFFAVNRQVFSILRHPLTVVVLIVVLAIIEAITAIPK